MTVWLPNEIAARLSERAPILACDPQGEPTVIDIRLDTDRVIDRALRRCWEIRAGNDAGDVGGYGEGAL